jgi:2'-5' RNA ligase
MRLFVALDLDPAVRDRLLAVAAGEPLSGQGVKWVRPEALHVTLRFLGAVDPARISAVTRAMREATFGRCSFAVTMRGLGCFPSRRAPRVFWAGMDRCAPLGELVAVLEAELRKAGFAPDDRPFRPHVTLARIRRPGVRPQGDWDRDRPDFGTQTVEEITLYESRHEARHPTYIPIHRTRLEGSGDS